jgi:hypothetical protein
MTEEEKQTIDNMTQAQMARIWRFAPSGNKYMISGTELGDYFVKSFQEKGGFTPAISKQIGWNE